MTVLQASHLYGSNSQATVPTGKKEKNKKKKKRTGKILSKVWGNCDM
jgi:hypothetical protein